MHLKCSCEIVLRYALKKYALSYVTPPLDSELYNQIAGRSYIRNIYLVWGESISSDCIWEINKVNQFGYTHQISAPCAEATHHLTEGVMVKDKELAQLETSPPPIDISKRNKEEVDAPSYRFVRYVLLFSIVHQVPQHPCNTAADVWFSLWSSATVQKPQGKWLSLSKPGESDRKKTSRLKSTDRSEQNENRVCKVPLFFFFHILDISSWLFQSSLYMRGFVFLSQTYSEKQAKKKTRFNKTKLWHT